MTARPCTLKSHRDVHMLGDWTEKVSHQILQKCKFYRNVQQKLIERWLKISPDLKHFATLACEMLVFDISQGSAVTRLGVVGYLVMTLL